MPFSSALPPALMDLTILRLSGVLSPRTFSTFRTRLGRRENPRGGLAVRVNRTDSQALGLVKELERRVVTLDETIQAEESASHAPYYTEEELMAVYKDVLVVPVAQSEIHDRAELDPIQRTETPTEDQRHLHIQTLLNATSLETLPTSALELLHYYEGQNLPAPMKTYTSVIASLFSRPASLARAQAWDLFAHMRYVAHPKPDVLLYTLMIRACASPVNTRYPSEPEKALDLWTEMTQEQKIIPTVGSYNAIILACARSGTKTYVNEALRLTRQMLDSHRDAQGFPAFRPDRKTFCALLEGAKRIGDLGRARWILAQMVRGEGVNTREEVDIDKDTPVEIDEEIMMHMFHAYAAYRPPFRRTATTLLEQPTPEQQQPVSQPPTTNAAIEADDTPSFAHIPPQSRSEVIREVKVLFQRTVEDRNSSTTTATATPSLPFSERKFKNVSITTRLIASYLSVFYKHASLEASREVFWKIFEENGVVRSLRVYVEALERCANSRRGTERKIALKFADELWIKWRETEQGLRTQDAKQNDPRLTERAHIAMVRVLAVCDETDRAMDHLKAFAAQYPPNDIRTPTPKTVLRSTRTALVGPRPLVRMTSETEVPDDHVPPLMMFRDIEVLHHRLTDEGRSKDIGYVTWLCKAYEWALRVRRDAAVKAKVPEVKGNSPTTEAPTVVPPIREPAYDPDSRCLSRSQQLQ